MFLMLNLFVMVIVEGYEVLDDNFRGRTESQITPFQKAWAEFDPKAIGYIKEHELVLLIAELPAPLGTFPNHNLHPKLTHLIAKRIRNMKGYDFSFEETLVHAMTSSVIFHAKQELDMTKMVGGLARTVAKFTIQKWLVREVRQRRYQKLQVAREEAYEQLYFEHRQQMRAILADVSWEVLTDTGWEKYDHFIAHKVLCNSPTAPQFASTDSQNPTTMYDSSWKLHTERIRGP